MTRLPSGAVMPISDVLRCCWISSLAAFVACATATPAQKVAPKPSVRASIPLPDVSASVRGELGMPDGAPVPNSIKAWQYKPGLGAALQMLGKAIHGDARLSKVTATELVTVVTSRNGCFY